MGAPYSSDLRSRVVEAYERKEGSIRELAKRFKLSPDCVRRWLKQYRETGEVKQRPWRRRGREPRVSEAEQQAIQVWLVEQPDLRVEDLCQKYTDTFEKPVGRSTMHRVLQRLGLSRKKIFIAPS